MLHGISDRMDPQKNNNNFLIFAYWHDKGWKQFVGATVKIWDLAHNLAALGNHVVLFLPKYHFKDEGLPFRLVQIPLLDLPFLRSISFNIALSAYLIWQGLRLKADVVYVRRGISILPALFARIRKSLLIYEINDDPYRKNNVQTTDFISKITDWLALKTDETTMRLSDAVFVITRPLKEKIIQKNQKISKERLHILPSGANTDLFKPMETAACRKRLMLDPAKKYVCFVGTLLDHQGLHVLIEAAPLILRSVPDVCFVIIGEGPMRKTWERQGESLLLTDKILFTGQIAYEEMPFWINAMDVCTAPFLKGAGLRSPVKIFDYMACGKPVVASRIVDATGIFEDSDAIALIEPEDPHALAESVVDLLMNKDKAGIMARNGRTFVEKHYSRKRLAEQILYEVQSLPSKKFSSKCQ